MIRLLTPEDMELVIALDGELRRSEIAEKFDVPEITIWNYIDEYKEKGIEAFSIKILVEWKRDEMKGKDAHQCGNVIRALGVSVHDNYMRKVMRESDIDYHRVCVNPYSKHVYNGIKGLKAIAKSVGMPKATIEHRILVQGMSIEEAVNPDNGNYKYEWRGIAGIKNIARQIGVPVSTLGKKAREQGITAAVNQALQIKGNAHEMVKV